MRNHTRRPLAAIAAAGAMLLTAAAPAAAAPDDTGKIGPGNEIYEVTSPEKGGFVYTSTVSNEIPPCTPMLFDCHAVLIEVTEDAQRLKFSTSGTPSDTFSDIDLHVFRSNADGEQLMPLGESTSPELWESVTVNSTQAKAGYYLAYVDWYFGFGAADIEAQFTPLPEPDPEPEPGS